ncbi:MAG: PA1571 family protein [Porticoccus sp.]
MNIEQKDKTSKEQDPDFHGAALIDEDGNEILITEGMVQEACADLDEEAGNTNDVKPSSSSR